MEQLRYPIGLFKEKEAYTSEDVQGFLTVLADLPEKMKDLISDITVEQLNTPYREGGWTARQVVHHVADSHMNMLVRIKWALTEDEPTIKPYWEDRWALGADYSLPVEVSISMLKGIHQKTVHLLKSLDDAQLSRRYFHPESKKYLDLKAVMSLYAWHSEHHLAHIKICKGEWKEQSYTVG